MVLAVWDVPPKFDRLGYEFTVDENVVYGSLIGNVRVTTSENLSNKLVNMKLINAAPGVFHLDGKGALRVNAQLDYEKKARYHFNIKVLNLTIQCTEHTINPTIITSLARRAQLHVYKHKQHSMSQDMLLIICASHSH